MGVEVLRGKWRITERRDGCVFKTEFEGNEWVDIHSEAAKMHTVGDIQWASPTVADDEPTIRRAP